MQRLSHSNTWRLAGLMSALLLIVSLIMMPGQADATNGLIKQALSGKLRGSEIRTPAGIKRRLPTISNGTLAAARSAAVAPAEEIGDSQDMREEEADFASSNDPGVLGAADGSLGCGSRITTSSARNVRVNQDCTFRRQAEELIKANPTNPQNLIAGQNDSRIGFNHCGFDFSFDGGKSWGDGIPPFYQRLNGPIAGHTFAGGPGTGHTYDAASDPALTFDSRGNAYYSCVVFDVNSAASGILVSQSPAQAGGSFYNNVPAGGARYVVVEDNNPSVFHDKEFIVADSNPNSPYRDNIYITWTLFQDSGSPIYFAKSSDGAQTWSEPMEISGINPDLCFFGNFFDPATNEHSCNFDQGSDPIVLPDGTIVVTFNNGNTPATNPNGQQLAVVSKDGGATWSDPVKVGDDVLGGPTCNFGRGPEQCIPGAFIRTNDFPRIAVDKRNGTVYAVWQDFRGGQINITLSTSTDGGMTWHESAEPVNRTRGDHYMPAIDIGNRGQIAISYYLTAQVPNEGQQSVFAVGDPGVQATSSTVVLASRRSARSPFRARTITPPFPPPDGIQAGFNGDYAGLVVVGDTAIPIWSDTRNTALSTVPGQGVIHDEDIFIARVSIGD